MADRLSQLQDAVNVQADNLCNGIGVLQQMAHPTSFMEFPTFNRSISSAYQQTLLEAGVPPLPNSLEDNNNDDDGEKIEKTNGDSNINNKKSDEPDRTGASELIEQSLNPSQPTPLEQPDNAKLFAKLITKTAKDIDLIIDSLPTQEIESDIQEAHIRRLEMENEIQAKELEAAIEQGESMLNVIKDALDDITQHLMMMKQLESRMLSSSSNSTTNNNTDDKLLNSNDR